MTHSKWRKTERAEKTEWEMNKRQRKMEAYREAPPFLLGLGHMHGAQKELLTQQKSSLGTGEARRRGQNIVQRGGVELQNKKILSQGIKIQLQSNVYIAPLERFKCKSVFAWRGCNDVSLCWRGSNNTTSCRHQCGVMCCKNLLT